MVEGIPKKGSYDLISIFLSKFNPLGCPSELDKINLLLLPCDSRRFFSISTPANMFNLH